MSKGFLVVKNTRNFSQNLQPKRSLNACLGHSKVGPNQVQTQNRQINETNTSLEHLHTLGLDSLKLWRGKSMRNSKRNQRRTNKIWEMQGLMFLLKMLLFFFLGVRSHWSTRYFLLVIFFGFLGITRFHAMRFWRKLEDIFLSVSASRTFFNQHFRDQTTGKPQKLEPQF